MMPPDRDDSIADDPRSPGASVRRSEAAEPAQIARLTALPPKTPASFCESAAFFHQEDPMEAMIRELHECRHNIGILAREVLRLHELVVAQVDDAEALVGSLDAKVEEIAEALLFAPAISAAYQEGSEHFHARAGE